jgi:predicted dinucleotide-binding enzyme
MTKTKVGVFGTGNVGQVLATGMLGLGHEVMLAGREASNEKALAWAKKNGERASVGTFADAAAFGEIIILATLWTGTENALKLAGPERLRGKLVIDATNPLAMGPTGPSLAIGHTDSGGEQVQRWLPGAHVVKCWNTVGNALMVNPNLPGGKPDMFIAGNDAAAKKTVGEILTAFGWETVDIGGIEGARLLEPLCILWVKYGVATGTWMHAFKLLRK